MAHHSPPVSIVMPAYNAAAYVADAVGSVQRQTHTHWELLIVDDGSTDNTAEVLSAIKDERIRVLTQAHAGMAKARRKALKETRGEFVAFLDADDLWHPAKLEKQLAAFHQYPDACFSLTGGYDFETPGLPLSFFYRQQEGELCGDIFPAMLRSEVALLVPSLVVKRACLALVLNNDYPFPAPDVAFLLELAARFPAIVLHEPLLFRRVHPDNHSTSAWQKGYTGMVDLLRFYRTQNRVPKRLTAQALFGLYINFGEDCLRRKQYRQAVGKFWRAAKARPFNAAPFKKTGKAIARFLQQA